MVQYLKLSGLFKAVKVDLLFGYFPAKRKSLVSDAVPPSSKEIIAVFTYCKMEVLSFTQIAAIGSFCENYSWVS